MLAHLANNMFKDENVPKAVLTSSQPFLEHSAVSFACPSWATVETWQRNISVAKEAGL